MRCGNCRIILTLLLLLVADVPSGRAGEPQNPSKQKTKFERPEGLMQGGAFIDLVQPIPTNGKLVSDCWGGDNVKPRVISNGIEDPKWSYWCASRLPGPDGKEHLFTVRWPQEKGHKYWVRSELVHAVSDTPTGPFTVIEDMGPGHNAEAYQTKDGTYVVTVNGTDYRSNSINGPWEKVRPQFDVVERSMSNKTFARREDGSFLLVVRSGSLWISDDGLKPYRRIFPTSVYPFALAGGSTAFEDPVIWRDEVQYHMIVNNWPLRRAFYGRSRDGLHWIWDPFTAFDHNVVRHPDGTVEGWNKIERPKVRQDEFGRATHMYLAVIDSPKDEVDGTNTHSSKSVVVPLVVGRRLTILGDQPITADTASIRVEIKAEPGFDPHSDVDIASLTLGASETVNFGKGCRAISSEKSGANLIVTFEGKVSGLKSTDYVAKLIGKTTRGELLFGYARIPGQPTHEQMLIARMPQLSRGADGSLRICVPVENVGLTTSNAPSSIKMILRRQKQGAIIGKELQSTNKTVPALQTYGSANVELLVTSETANAGSVCDIDVVINHDTPAADTFSFNKITLP